MMPSDCASHNNTDSKELKSSNIFINGYNLVDIVNSIARDEIKNEIKKDIDIVTMEEYGKLVSIISVKDDMIEGLENSNIEKDIIIEKNTIIEKNETKMKEQDDYMKELKCYMEALKNSNIEKDTKNGKLEERLEKLENSNIEKDTRIGNLENSNVEKDTRIGNLENSNVEKDTRIGNLENSNVEKDTKIVNLEMRVDNLYDELEPLRSRQLIEAGRKYFWNKGKREYELKFPKMVVHKSYFNHSTKRHVNFTEPKEWNDFINYAKMRFGKASYWILLKGGFNSDFACYSSIIHKTDAYTIAKRNMSTKPLPSNYNDLFVTVFKITMVEALIRVPP
jgi:uncharacterized coiled-coil protein SlyX